MKLHCDSCGKALGTYLYGRGGIEERATIFKLPSGGLPDVLCNGCLDEGYSIENPKYPEKVYSQEYLNRHKSGEDK